MALTPEQLKASLASLTPSDVKKAVPKKVKPLIEPSTTTTTTEIMPQVASVQPLLPKQNIMSPSLEVQSGVQPEKDYKALATPEEKSKVIRMLQAGIPEATVRAGFRQAIDRRLTQENTARGQEPKNYVDQNNMPIQPDVPLQGGIRYAPSRTPGILPEPVENFFEKANPIGRLTQFIDENVQKIPTITRKSVAEAFKGTPFEGMEALPTMVANTPGSLLKTASATARGITNPFDTLVGLGKLALTEEGHQAIIDRYGSIEGLKKTMTEDPVGLASDALTLVQGGAGLAGKGAKMAGFANTAKTLSNVGKVAGVAADLGLGLAIPKGLTKIASLGANQPGLANKALNTVAKSLVGGTQPIQSVKDSFNEMKSLIPTKPLEKVIQKDVIKGFRPGVKQVELAGGQEQYVQKATDAVKTISKLKDQIELTTSDGEKITGKTPETISQLDESIPQAKRKIYEAYSSEAEKAGTVSRIDTTPIVQELLTLRDKMKKMIGGGNTVSYIDNVIKDIQNKGQMGVIDALDNTQQLNSKLQAYYRNPNPNDIGNSVVDALVNSKLKEGIDTTIDSSLLDSKYADIKKQYANLKAIEKDVKNRSTVFARGNNKGFFDITDIFTAGEAINAITSFSPAGVVKSGGMFALKELWKYLNSPDTAVKNIFKEVNKQVGEQIQPSTTLNQKGLPLLEKKTPITPTGVVQEATPIAPVPTVQTKTPIVEKGRATHDPYKTVTMDTKVVAPKKTVVPKTTPVVPKPNNNLVEPKVETVLDQKAMDRIESRIYQEVGDFKTVNKYNPTTQSMGNLKIIFERIMKEPGAEQYLKSQGIKSAQSFSDYIHGINRQIRPGINKARSELYKVVDENFSSMKLNAGIEKAGMKGPFEYKDTTQLEKALEEAKVKRTIVPVKKEVVQSTTAPKTVNVWIKSKFSNEGAYKDIPVIEKVDNITLYQGGSDGKRQFWTKDKKYAEQFGKVQEKTGSFYKVDNGNRVTDVYVEATAPKKQSVLPKPQEKQAILEGKKEELLFRYANKENINSDMYRGGTWYGEKDLISHYKNKDKNIALGGKELFQAPKKIEKPYSVNTDDYEVGKDILMMTKFGKSGSKLGYGERPNFVKDILDENTYNKVLDIVFEKEDDILLKQLKSLLPKEKYDLISKQPFYNQKTMTVDYLLSQKLKKMGYDGIELLENGKKREVMIFDKKSLIPTPKAPVSTTPEVSYTKSPEGKRLADGKPIKEDSNTYRMLDRAEKRKLEAKKAKVEPVSKVTMTADDVAGKFTPRTYNGKGEVSMDEKLKVIKNISESRESKKLPLDKLSFDIQGLGFIDKKTSISNIKGILEDIAKGKPIDPIIINKKGEVIDGNHRMIAQYIAGIKNIDTISPLGVDINKFDNLATRTKGLEKSFDMFNGEELRKIREEANTTNKVPVKTPVPVKKVEPVSKELQPLYDEAKKYKTADEYLEGLRSKLEKDMDILTQKAKKQNPTDPTGYNTAKNVFLKDRGITDADMSLLDNNKYADIKGMEDTYKQYVSRGQSDFASQQKAKIESAKKSNTLFDKYDKIMDDRDEFFKKNEKKILMQRNKWMTDEEANKVLQIKNMPTVPELRKIREEAQRQ